MKLELFNNFRDHIIIYGGTEALSEMTVLEEIRSRIIENGDALEYIAIFSERRRLSLLPKVRRVFQGWASSRFGFASG